MTTPTAGFGVRTVLAHGGEPVPYALPSRTVPDPLVASRLAEAEGTVGGGLGATWDGGRGVLTFVSRPQGPRRSVTAGSAGDVAGALEVARRDGLAALEVSVSGDLGGPAARWAGGDPSLAPRLSGHRIDVPAGEPLAVDLVLVGRGVVRAGAVPELQAFAARVGIGVLNTYTAKGVFRWDSPYHFGTGCLQERDLALAGVGPDASVLAVGVDADECVPALLRAAGLGGTEGFASIAPWELAVADVRPARGGELKPPPLYSSIFDIAQPLYALTGAPLNPARAAADIAEVLPEGGAVCTEPGLAGWWVGRTLPTRRLGSARVPAAGLPGTAVAGALLGALDGQPRVAVVAGALGDADLGLLEWARGAGLDVTVVVWTPDGPARDAEQHREALAAAIAEPGVTVLPVAVDPAATDRLVEAAGPLVAW